MAPAPLATRTGPAGGERRSPRTGSRPDLVPWRWRRWSRGYQMRVLILGGTDFLGRHFAEAIPKRDLTLFNRGRTNPGLFPTAWHLTGDRSSDVSALRGGRWDVAIDCSGQFPDWVRRTVDALKNAVGLYVYI